MQVRRLLTAGVSALAVALLVAPSAAAATKSQYIDCRRFPATVAAVAYQTHPGDVMAVRAAHVHKRKQYAFELDVVSSAKTGNTSVSSRTLMWGPSTGYCRPF